MTAQFAIDRALAIAKECGQIDQAIEQLIAGWRNQHLGGDQFGVYSTGLFQALNERRRALRQELVEMK